MRHGSSTMMDGGARLSSTGWSTVLERAASTMALAALMAASALAAAPPRELTVERRVELRSGVEEVYWWHRQWPAANHGAKPSLASVLTPEALRRRVERSLAASAALGQVWGRPLSAAMLEAEVVRMARDSRDPVLLRQLFAVLDDDPVLVAEVLARPALAQRLATSFYARDPRFHSELRTRAAADLAGWQGLDELRRAGVDVAVTEWVVSETPRPTGKAGVREITAADLAARVAELRAAFGVAAGAPLPVGRPAPLTERDDCFASSVVVAQAQGRLTLAELVWRKTPFTTWLDSRPPLPDRTAVVAAPFNLPSLPYQSCAEGTWSSIPESLRLARSGSSAVWTGTEMIVWGGIYQDDTGARYTPATDTWSPVTTAGAPSGRYHHLAAWTGTEMLVWGGDNGGQSGGRYDPTSDTWQAMSAAGSPEGTMGGAGVWTGTELLVWGGGGGSTWYHSTGGRYDPATDAWTPMSTTGAPAARHLHTAVWTGSTMLVWGGDDDAGPRSDGGRYDPATDTWSPIATFGAPGARFAHSAVWSGSRMLVWGGLAASSTLAAGGGRYDPAADAWQPVSEAGGPGTRLNHTAVWTGDRMLVWGGVTGTSGSQAIATGGSYDPANDAWSTTSTTGAPEPRADHSAVWTGTEMIVFGGGYPSGGRYDPAADTWVRTGTPPGLQYPQSYAFVATGAEILAASGGQYDGANQRFDPATGAWSPIAFAGAKGAPLGVWTGTEAIFGSVSRWQAELSRYDPASDTWTPSTAISGLWQSDYLQTVWTGSRMIVWGGAGGDDFMPVNTGARYDPASDTWAATSLVGAPIPRLAHSMAWTPGGMVVWGGETSDLFGYWGPIAFTNTGGVYDPSSDTWRPTTLVGAPSARCDASAAWTGSEMVVWGGAQWSTGTTSYHAENTGARYDPTLDQWWPMSTSGAPPAREGSSAVWTGAEVVLWGGYQQNLDLADGAAYDTLGDSWRSLPATGAPYARHSHFAAWSTAGMTVLGGVDHNGYRLYDGGSLCQLQLPRILASPGSIDFGRVVTGRQGERDLVITAAGLEPLIVTSVSAPAPPFATVADGCTGVTLAHGDRCTVTLAFAPTAVGAFAGTVEVVSNDPDTPTLAVPLSGTGVQALLVPASVTLLDDSGNGVLEPWEEATLQPRWTNQGLVATAPVTGTLTGVLMGWPLDASASYGTVAPDATAGCIDTGDCYRVQASFQHPALHRDAVIRETLATGEQHDWVLHIGASFDDVAPTVSLYPFVETVLHHGITQGCSTTSYCPATTVSRAQMAMFLARAMAGSDQAVPTSGTIPGWGAYRCGPGGASRFGDVAVSASYCRHVHYLAAAGVTAGCTATSYCPTSQVTRAQMAMFVSRSVAGGDSAVPLVYQDAGTGRVYSCDPAQPTLHFSDVPATAQYCRHTHYLWARGAIDGCTATAYCPAPPTTRLQMAKFLARGFGLELYGP